MPRYEYRCRTCDDTFEVSRPMAESSAPADCPAGHADTVKLLSAVAVGGAARGGPAAAPAPAMGGGCCGGGGCG
ncbi:FmdB family zinc ribbon protein [Streptomyces sp. NPDC054838]